MENGGILWRGWRVEIWSGGGIGRGGEHVGMEENPRLEIEWSPFTMNINYTAGGRR